MRRLSSQGEKHYLSSQHDVLPPYPRVLPYASTKLLSQSRWVDLSSSFFVTLLPRMHFVPVVGSLSLPRIPIGLGIRPRISFPLDMICYCNAKWLLTGLALQYRCSSYGAIVYVQAMKTYTSPPAVETRYKFISFCRLAPTFMFRYIPQRLKPANVEWWPDITQESAGSPLWWSVTQQAPNEWRH